MEKSEELAKEYCEKNIPSLPQMHQTISTAFEAGYDAGYYAAMKKLHTQTLDKVVGVVTSYFKEIGEEGWTTSSERNA